MRNNILGGLVIFVVVMACLLMLDDITNTPQEHIINKTESIQTKDDETSKELATLGYRE
ncbi:hypothetical protein [uncultured Winogradskyella sp.]|uniref:hypothetical protein n=1 Tax=uncultured Winogradskyella sp. TaxID=395353 RepID=UPI00260435DC|nr:hypothetical protein [uncultured Winogradskyella sp.]